MVLPNFVRQSLAGEPITVYGSGQQSRCFCDVRDTVEAILRLLANSHAIGEVVNIGTDREISIEGLAKFVKARTKSESSIVFVPYEEAYEPGFEDMPRRVPALEKLEILTGFRPTTTLEEIVDRVVGHRREKTEKEMAGRAGATTGPGDGPSAAARIASD
jgi:UDP-glucose 4-epimerase